MIALDGSSKLALYSSLHGTVSEHRVVLMEREKMLNGARENLLKDGEAVVGGGSGGFVDGSHV